MTQPGDLIGIVDQVATTDKHTHKIIISAPVK